MATESQLCLGCSVDNVHGTVYIIYGCSDAIPRTCDREYEKRLVDVVVLCRAADHSTDFSNIS